MDDGGQGQTQTVRRSKASSIDEARDDREDEGDHEAVELVHFHVKECYVYLIPPRKTAASYRADEWNVNKWHWEGALKVISKGEECIIRLEDRTTGELFARAFLRSGEPHPVEPVIDSSRYFVLRVEENFGGRIRHAFIGLGFRERPQAYDFQAAIHDHMKYLNKKLTAEQMEQHYQASTSSVDYSLKDGETLVLQIKNNGSGRSKSAFFERLNSLSKDEKPTVNEEGMLGLKLPPPPAPLSPVSPVEISSFSSSASKISPNSTLNDSSKIRDSSLGEKPLNDEPTTVTEAGARDVAEDDFGDFQVAG